MKKIIFLLIGVCVTTIVFSQTRSLPPDTSFERSYGGSNFDEGRDVKELYNGDFIIAGTTSSYGQGNTSVYLVRTDSLGIYKWSGNYGGQDNDWAYSIEVCPDSGYFICGYSNSFGDLTYNGYYLRTDKNGNQLWQKYVGGNDWDFLYASALLPDSGFVVCGESYTYSNGSADAWVIRSNKNGDTLWTKHFGGSNDDVFRGVEYYNNRIYLSGKTFDSGNVNGQGWVVKLDMNGNFIQEYRYDPFPLENEAFNGIDKIGGINFLLSGQITDAAISNKSKFLVVKIDSTLNWLVDEKGFTYNDNNITRKSIENASGEIISVGSYQGSGGGWGGVECYVNHMNNLFQWIGSAAYGKYGDEYGYSMCKRSGGGYAYVGSTTSYGYGAEDVYLCFVKGAPVIYNYYISLVTYKDTLPLWIVSNELNAVEVPQLKLFPIPANDLLNLEMINMPLQENTNLSIININGEKVFDATLTNTQSLQINTSGFAAGIYFVELRTAYKLFRQKIVVQR